MHDKRIYALNEAISTLRKTTCFGDNRFPIGFEWPSPINILQMPKYVPIYIVDLKYKLNTGLIDGFCAFQVVLSNGESSPVFTAKG
jgi:hypothetical protein